LIGNWAADVGGLWRPALAVETLKPKGRDWPPSLEVLSDKDLIGGAGLWWPVDATPVEADRQSDD